MVVMLRARYHRRRGKRSTAQPCYPSSMPAVSAAAVGSLVLALVLWPRSEEWVWRALGGLCVRPTRRAVAEAACPDFLEGSEPGAEQRLPVASGAQDDPQRPARSVVGFEGRDVA